MEKAILSIINEIPKNHIFDSHFIINELIKGYSDVYLTFASNYASNNSTVTLTSHRQIGKKINELDGTVLAQVGKAWSENIHKRPSECTCWKKL